MSGLEQDNFNLWGHLYGFVISGIKKAILNLSEAGQLTKTTETQLEPVLKDLKTLMREIEQLKTMDWRLLS